MCTFAMVVLQQISPTSFARKFNAEYIALLQFLPPQRLFAQRKPFSGDDVVLGYTGVLCGLDMYGM